MDGHTGIEMEEVNRGGSGNFQLILAYLKEASGRSDFVIHASSSISYSAGLQPLAFLSMIGFTHFRGECKFHHDRCFYRHVATIKKDPHGFASEGQVDSVHRAFSSFAEKIGELFTLEQQQERILRQLGLESQPPSIFGPVVNIEISETDAPPWIEEVKFERLKQLEGQVKTAEGEIDDLKGYLPLLYGTGDALVCSVLKALRFLGLEAETTEPGFTADILAQTEDGSKRFGLEVTGINGPVKKESKKLTQVLEFERVKEHGEKTILLANTHNAVPISEREKLEDFTPQVIDFLGKFPILLMTSWDLYRIVKGVMEGGKEPSELVDMLYTTNGLLKFA